MALRLRPWPLLFMALVTILAFTVLVASHAQAQSANKGGPLGFGVILGEPSAITGKYMMNKSVGIDGGLAFDFGRWLLVYSDWLYHVPGAFGTHNEFAARLSPYLGVGGLMIVSNKGDAETRRERYFTDSSASKLAVGIRFPLGLEWRPARVPIGVFLELVPGMTIAPATNGFMQGGLGARFFF